MSSGPARGQRASGHWGAGQGLLWPACQGPGFSERLGWMFTQPDLQARHRTNLVVHLSIPFIVSDSLTRSELTLRS